MNGVTVGKSASIRPPRQQYCRDSGPATEVIELPEPEFRQQWFTIQNTGSDNVYMRFGRSAAEVAVVDPTVRSGIAPLTFAGQECWLIPPGGELHFNMFELRIDQRDGGLFFAHATDPAGSSVIRFYASSGPVEQ